VVGGKVLERRERERRLTDADEDREVSDVHGLTWLGVEDSNLGGPHNCKSVVDTSAETQEDTGSEPFSVLEDMERKQRLLDGAIYIPHDESDKSEETNNNGRDDSSRLPWVNRTAPAETEQEDDESGGEQEGTKVVEVLDPVHLAVNVTLMLLVEGGREVEASPERQSDHVEREEEPVDSAPSNRVAGDESIRDGRSETTAGNAEDCLWEAIKSATAHFVSR
jgi:hypothetical protein